MALSVLTNADSINEIFQQSGIFHYIKDKMTEDSYLMYEKRIKILSYSIIISNDLIMKAYIQDGFFYVIYDNIIHELGLIALTKFCAYDAYFLTIIDIDYINLLIKDNPKLKPICKIILKLL